MPGLAQNVLAETLTQKGFRDGTVIFVDLARGSCWVAVEKMRRERKNVYLISGVNLPMLLRFFYKRDTLDLPILFQNVREGGLDGIQTGGYA